MNDILDIPISRWAEFWELDRKLKCKDCVQTAVSVVPTLFNWRFCEKHAKELERIGHRVIYNAPSLFRV